MHIVKTPPYQVSKLGVAFTMQAIYSMRWWVARFQKQEPQTILWGIIHDAHGQLKVGLAADPNPYAECPADEIEGMPFRWVIGRDIDFSMVRDTYCVDYDRDKEKTYLVLKNEVSNK